MTIADVRIYECEMQRETNEKVVKDKTEEEEEEEEEGKEEKDQNDQNDQGENALANGLGSPKTPSRGWFSWS